MDSSSKKSTIKYCIHCSHELPAEASFCPYCEKEQTEKVSVQAPPRKHRTIAALVLALFTAALILFLLWRIHLPKTYQGGSKISYPIGNQTVDVIASFDLTSGEDGHLGPDTTDRIAEGDQSAMPLWLCVYNSSDSSLAEKFADQIASCTVEAVPAAVPVEAAETASEPDAARVSASSPMEIYGPDPVDDASIPALWKADLVYAPENGTNELKWTITMKNKDTILLSQTMTCTPMPVKDLYYQDVPLETVEDIEAAMHTVSEDTILNLHLPPVTYTEPLDLSERCVNLYGTSDGSQSTTFAAQITVHNRIPNEISLSDIAFTGNGKTALLLQESAIISHCSFTGWDVGIDAQNGSWPLVESCTFEENQIGFRFNSDSCSSSSDGCYASTFRNNGIGAYLIQIPGDLDYGFPDCTFEGNQEDVRR